MYQHQGVVPPPELAIMQSSVSSMLAALQNVRRSLPEVDQSMQPLSQPVVHSPDVWFADGTVILQAESSLFRVYLGVLSAQSSVFRNIFAIRDATYAANEGCPLHVVHDYAHELKVFLLAVHDSGYFTTNRANNMRTLSSLMKLATKYDVEHTRNSVVSILIALYPPSLPQYLERGTGFPFHRHPGDQFITLNLYVNHDTVPAIVLPGIYYGCCRSRTVELFSAPIAAADKELCLHALERFNSASVFSFLFQESDHCDDGECTTARLRYIEDIDGIPEFGNVFEPNFFDWENIGLCESCVENAQEFFEAEREQLWEDLPRRFELVSWEELY
ncbi:hypothetical protein C8R43DRAFT_967195 [Mycena crocata]|nr:hypothetical protein C8R43DRAFT_967195 [Mycena crocata]